MAVAINEGTRNLSAEPLPAAAVTRDSLPLFETLADEIVWRDRDQHVRPGLEFRLGAGFSDPAILPPDVAEMFDKRRFVEQTRTFRIRDVTLDASLMALCRGRVPIPDTLYLVSDIDFDYALVKPIDPRPTDPNQHYIVGCNRASRNYYHWIIQALPAIDWGLRNRAQPGVTVATLPLRPWQEESLALLGHAGVPRLVLHPNAHYALASAEYSEFLGWRMSGIVSYAAAATWEKLRNAVPPAADGARVIYVARTDATRRAIANEPELIDLLEQRGVRIVVPGQLSVARQIAMFRRARLVIGPHGAELSNIAFCEPGSHVYELLSNHYPNFTFSRIAQSTGLNYWADMFATASSGSAHEQSWRVDLDVVAARLDSIQEHMAATLPPENAMEFLRQNAAQVDPAPPRRGVSQPAPRGLLRRIFGRSR